MIEEQLNALAQNNTDEAVQQVIAMFRQLQQELSQAPTLEQMHSLVSQLKEVRGENSKLREELQRLQKTGVGSQSR
jgi:Protein of unknown function (DUF2730)